MNDRDVAGAWLGQAGSEAALVEALDALGIGISVANERGAIVFANDALCRIVGYTAAEFRAMETFFGLIAPEARPAAVERFRRRAAGWELVETFDTVILRKDGHPVPVEVSSKPIKEYGGRLVISVIRNISARKRAEDSLRESEERFRRIAENSPDIIYRYRLTPDRQVEYMNPAATEITGYTPEEHYADPVLGLKSVHPDDIQIATAFVEAPEKFDRAPIVRLIRKDGTVRWIEQRIAVLRDDEGNTIGFEGVTRDVTERKLIEEALRETLDREREASERLRALDEMKNTFLSAVSHDLRTPLAAIVGFSEVLEMSHERLSADEVHQITGRLAANARTLERLLSDLLDLDRLTRGAYESRRLPTDLGELVRTVAGNIDATDHLVHIETDHLTAVVDPSPVERIVENLLTNAVRHTPSGTSVWVRVSRDADGVLLVVEDAGPGIPDELKVGIFEPFRRGDVGVRVRGTGIGLSLVARFAALHGGRAWVEDRPGGGASFRVLLPGA